MGVSSLFKRAFTLGIAVTAVIALAFTLPFSSPVRAEELKPSAKDPACVVRKLRLFERMWSSSTDYISAVGSEGWKRALVRPRTKSELAYPKRWRLFKRLERTFEDRLLGPQKTLTAPASLAINTALLQTPVVYEDHKKKQLLHLVQTDFRYNDIDEDLQKGGINQQGAIVKAQVLKPALDAFDHEISDPKTREQLQSDPQSAIQDLRKNPNTATLFAPLNYMVDGWVYKLATQKAQYRFAPGVKPTSSPTQAQIDKLYALEFQKWEAFSEIPGWFHSLSKSPKGLDPASQAIYESIQSSPLTQKLETMLRSHQITRELFRYFLMKDYSWQILFEQCQVMGVQMLKASDPGSALTIDDIREGILYNISQAEKAGKTN